MEWHTLNKNIFIFTRNEDKAVFDGCTIMNSEKGNRILGNFAIDEKGTFKIMLKDKQTHTHTHTHIDLGFVQERQTQDTPKSCSVSVKNVTGN
jgi:hypothetical protein